MAGFEGREAAVERKKFRFGSVPIGNNDSTYCHESDSLPGAFVSNTQTSTPIAKISTIEGDFMTVI
ncbi:hypothetical protein TSUD_366700 [Trifolium subterraneum]|uniref:Uncharacterized protein n=1 Tax=Trifolium subterraneum TaxID=3900 RepID=A0A2Z6MJK4_TRISU|nr:hypothetical protein TSUD_366700 [Trifolium subterraneum]